jgi:hypothetical protein
VAWVKLDDHFPEHPKLVSLGTTLPLAAWLYVCALCYCNRHLTDGYFPQQVVASWFPWQDDHTIGDRSVNSYGLATSLVDAGVWEHDPAAGTYHIHDYLDYQPSRAEALALRNVRSEAGRTGGLAKQIRSKPEAKPKQPSSKAEAKTCPVPVPVSGSDLQEPPTPSGENVDSVLAWFLEGYPRWYAEERAGARYLVRPALDGPYAQQLVTTWPDRAHLEAMARVFLRATNLVSAHANRSIEQFATKYASACDAKLRGAA